MRLWAVPSSVACCSRLRRPCCSSRRFLVLCTVTILQLDKDCRTTGMTLFPPKREKEKRMTPDEENVTSVPELETIERQAPDSPTNRLAPGPRRRRSALLFAAIALAVGAVIYAGIHSRAAAESRLEQRTEEAAIPTI